MIDQIDDRLKSWVETLPHSPSVSLAPPRDDLPDSGVSCYLLEIVDEPPLRTVKRTPLQMSLRYMVSSWAETPEEAHRVLGNLVFAAMAHSEFEVEFKPIPASLWTAFGVIPRPAFQLRVPCRKERPEQPAPPVQEPMVLKSAPLITLHGTVVGPGDIPLMMARVELPSLQRRTETDSNGQFRFTNVPGEEFSRQLRIRARGRELDITLDELPTEEEPLVIHFDPLN